MERRSKETKRERRLRRTEARIATGGITMFGRGDVLLFTGREKPSTANLPPEMRQNWIDAIKQDPYTSSLIRNGADESLIRASIRAATDSALSEILGQEEALPRD